jgi:hypothetical protein
MAKVAVAHLREQGQDMIIIPLDSDFHLRSANDQELTMLELQQRASSAGLRGTVVPVWMYGGRMHFIAPDLWHPFFRSFPYHAVIANLNREIHW